MELNLYFTNEEITDYLEKKGYVVREVTTWKVENVYHNSTETNYYKKLVAYRPEEETIVNDYVVSNNSWDVESKYSIETIFKRQIKKKILS